MKAVNMLLAQENLDYATRLALSDAFMEEGNEDTSLMLREGVSEDPLVILLLAMLWRDKSRTEQAKSSDDPWDWECYAGTPRNADIHSVSIAYFQTLLKHRMIDLDEWCATFQTLLEKGRAVIDREDYDEVHACRSMVWGMDGAVSHWRDWHLDEKVLAVLKLAVAFSACPSESHQWQDLRDLGRDRMRYSSMQERVRTHIERILEATALWTGEKAYA